MTHPVEELLKNMSEKDRKIAEELHKEGFSDEDLYAALSPDLPDYLAKG